MSVNNLPSESKTTQFVPEKLNLLTLEEEKMLSVIAKKLKASKIDRFIVKNGLVYTDGRNIILKVLLSDSYYQSKGEKHYVS